MEVLKPRSNYWPLFIIAYMAITGVLCVFSAQLYLGVKPDFLVGIICIGIIFGIYVLNRYSDALEDYANDISKYLFFSRHRFLFPLGIFAIVASSLTLMVLQKLHGYHLALIALGIGYSFKLFPWLSKGHGLVFHRLKDIPFVKNLVVAVAWGVTIFFMPVSFADQPIRLTLIVYLLSISCVILVLNNTLFSDIRDIKGDAIAQTKTLPVLWGARNCLFLLGAINGCWVAGLAVLNYFSLIAPAHFMFLLGVALFPLVYMLPYLLGRLSKTAVAFLSETDLLIFATGLFLLGV